MIKKVKKKIDGKMVIFTAPSGAGKTTIVRHLLEELDFVDFSVSATNRKRRKHEVDGKDYYFLSTRKIKTLIDKKAFVEWEEVYEGQFYGTLKSEVERLWKKNKCIVFDIDVKGATNIKKKYKEKCLAVFVKPPSFEVLVERLKNRKTETADSLKKRIKRIKRELKYEDKFDRVLVNDLLQVALKEAEMIVEDFCS